jgi:ribulose-phosphate 3-epimerase
MVEIAPSILAADFARLDQEIQAVKRGGASMIHLDVMDGHFVPNISLGPPVIQGIRRATDLFLDTHLMIEDPDRYVSDFVKAGAQRLTIHQEACRHLNRSLQLIRGHDALAGVAINPATPVSLLEEVVDLVDLVLVMSVNPGFGGQKFLPSALVKIRQLDRIRQERGLNFHIEVDGGIGLENVQDVVRSGCDIVVAGSSVFGKGDPAANVEALRQAVEQAQLLRA